MMHAAGLAGLALLLSVPPAHPCFLWGTDSGECTLLTYDAVWRRENMPFCFDAVSYPACVPRYQTVPPNRDFPEGRWFNHTVFRKDAWVRDQTIAKISQRIGFEKNRTMRNTGRNEFGDVGLTKLRFSKSDDCYNAYKNYFCWINFPRCDFQTDITLSTCRSACENYFKACNYENDLWRCGPSELFNGYAPEQPSSNQSYLRDYFPGQPFVGNKFRLNGEEIAVCTPAITGSAGRRVITAALGLALSLLSLFFLY